MSRADEERAWLVLGHGAGGGVTSRDLVATAEAALAQGVSVALVEQPYRVAGRRSPSPHTCSTPPGSRSSSGLLRSDVVGDVALVVGGRSSGARAACRTSEVTGPVGVLCLAFPLVPPSRTPALRRRGSRSSMPFACPRFVVQGERDPFGMPPGSTLRQVVTVSGDHSLSPTSCGRSRRPGLAAPPRGIGGARWLRPPPTSCLARLRLHHTNRSMGLAASCGGSMVMFGNRRSSQPGMYQDFSPMSVRNDGTSVIFTTSASVRIAIASRRPNSFEMRSDVRMNAAKTVPMMIAAATTTRPIAAMPPRPLPPRSSARGRAPRECGS